MESTDKNNEILDVVVQAETCRKGLEKSLGRGFDRKDGRRNNELVDKE